MTMGCVELLGKVKIQREMDKLNCKIGHKMGGVELFGFEKIDL